MSGFLQGSRTRMQQVFSARLARLPRGLGSHPGLKFDPMFEGYKSYTFGGRAGPSVSVSFMAHELAHAVEFGPDNFSERASERGFNFKNPKPIELFGELYYEPQTMDSVLRELRAIAIQMHILTVMGEKVRPYQHFHDSIQSLRFMPDWLNVPKDTSGERNEFCLRIAFEHFEAYRPPNIFQRLEGWLDATRDHLLSQEDAERKTEVLEFA